MTRAIEAMIFLMTMVSCTTIKNVNSTYIGHNDQISRVIDIQVSNTEVVQSPNGLANGSGLLDLNHDE